MFQVGEKIELGSPFSAFSQDSDTPIYYFPVISDGKIVATFRVGKISEQDSYTGVMSEFLADELTFLSKNIGKTAPVCLFVSRSGIMATVEDKTYIADDAGFVVQEEYMQVPNDLKVVNVLAPTDTVSSATLPVPYGASKYITLDITETQGIRVGVMHLQRRQLLEHLPIIPLLRKKLCRIAVEFTMIKIQN